MNVVAVVLLVVGVGIGFVGVLGFRERLPRNRFAGVRTPAAMRTDRTFRVANKVGGLPIAVAGAIGALSGLGTMLTGLTVILVVGSAGTVAIAVAGGVLGTRAAAAVPDEKPALPEGCRGCQCGGCDLAKSVGANVSGVRGQ